MSTQQQQSVSTTTTTTANPSTSSPSQQPTTTKQSSSSPPPITPQSETNNSTTTTTTVQASQSSTTTSTPPISKPTPQSTNTDTTKSSPPVILDSEYAVFVGEIARGTSDEELEKAFSKYGEVESAEVIRNKKTGETKGYGFVRFKELKCVEAAVDDQDTPAFLDSLTGKTTHVRISEADPKIPKSLSEDEVRTAIEQIVGITLVRFELHLHPDGTSKGYAWARFKSHDQALAALKALARSPFPSIKPTNGSNIPLSNEMDRPLSVKLAEPRAVDHRILQSVKALYVKNVNPESSIEELRTFFGGPNCVDRVFLPTLRGTHVPLGTAIVYYRERPSAEEFLHATDGAVFHGRRIHVEWCLPQEVLRPQKRNSNQGIVSAQNQQQQTAQQLQQLQMQMQMQLQQQLQQQLQAQQQQQTTNQSANQSTQQQTNSTTTTTINVQQQNGKVNQFVPANLAQFPLQPPRLGNRQTQQLMMQLQQQPRQISQNTTQQQSPQNQQQKQVQISPNQTGTRGPTGNITQVQQQQQQQRQRQQLEAAALAYNQYAAAAAAYGFLPIGGPQNINDPATVALMQAAAAAAAAAASGNGNVHRPGLYRRSQQPYQ